MGFWDDVGGYFKDTWESDRTFGAPEGSPLHSGLNKIGDFGGWAGENTVGTLVDAATGLINLPKRMVTPSDQEFEPWIENPFMGRNWWDDEQGGTSHSVQQPTGPISGPFPEGGAPWDNTIPEGTNELYDQLANPPTFEQDPYMPTGVGAATDQAYDTYMGLLENTVTGPSTDRIGNIYDLAMGEAARQNSAADRYEAGALANIETDSAALMENLGMLTEDFDTELDIIRERQSERIAGSKETRNDRIDQAIEDHNLGEAAATFLVSSTKTSDILDAQGSRQEVYSDRMDRLYAGWALDREMDALGLTQQAKRDVANKVLAMKENVAQFQYNARVQNQEMLMNAEAASANRANDLATTLAELGLQRDLAGIQAAETERGLEEAYDADWDRSAGWLEGPLGGMMTNLTPDMISAMDDSTLLAMAELTGQSSELPFLAPAGGGASFQIGDIIDGDVILDPAAMDQIAKLTGTLGDEYYQNEVLPLLQPDDV